MKKPRVLFLCTHNSARSQMTEGFLRAMAGDRFDAQSAGTEKTAVEILRRNNARDVGLAQGEWRDGSWRDFDPRTPLATV